MHLSCETSFIPHDPTLPGLATLLDPTAFAEMVQHMEPACPVQHVEISYIKYKPHTNCLAGYRVVRNGTTVDVYARALRQAKFKPATSTAHLTCAEQALELRFFPSDRRIVGLQALDDEHRPRLLQRLFPQQDETWWHSPLERLVYKPERRYVARLLVDGVPRAALKFYTQSRVAATERAKHAANRTTLRVPRFLGKCERHAVIASEWLPGRLAHAALHDPATDAGIFTLVGATLANLHNQSPSDLPWRMAQHEAEAIRAAATAVMAVSPPLAAQAQRLAEQLVVVLARQPTDFGLIHGDFHARQVLLQDDAVAFIDFDEAAYGNRVSDLANFLAHLEYAVLRSGLPQARAEAIREALLEGYHEVANSITTQALAQHTAARLLLLAPHPFRNQEPDWATRTAALLERVAELAQRKER